MELTKMLIIYRVMLTVLIFQSVKAAPNDLLTKLEQIAKVDTDSNNDDKVNTLLEDSNDSSITQGQRQKRFFNYYGYGFPPVSPIIYPSGPNNGPAYYDDPLTEIYKRLQDISTSVRQPNLPPPPPPHFPLFFPVIYIPQVGCGCTPDLNNPDRPTSPEDKNNTDVDVSNRFPEMEDERQNWGFVVNNTEEDDGKEEDFTRPISFEPIRPNRTMSRPPPALEHGSSQAGQAALGQPPTNPGQIFTTTTTSTTPRPTPPTTISPLPVEPPTACDGAVLSCCHQLEVTYDCFAVQGCPDPSIYGNPCENRVILGVIDRFQRFYGQRFG